LGSFDALVVVGGSGSMVDLNNQRLHDLISEFHALDKLIVCECYGVACLPFARELDRECYRSSASDSRGDMGADPLSGLPPGNLRAHRLSGLNCRQRRHRSLISSP
jgi:putative intracellular protease/amidase